MLIIGDSVGNYSAYLNLYDVFLEVMLS